MKDCKDLAKDFNLDFQCCDSCHDDDLEYGIEMNTEEINGEEYYLCCRASTAYEQIKGKL